MENVGGDARPAPAVERYRPASRHRLSSRGAPCWTAGPPCPYRVFGKTHRVGRAAITKTGRVSEALERGARAGGALGTALMTAMAGDHRQAGICLYND